MTSLLKNLGAETSGLIIQGDNFDTYSYIKKYYEEKEESRIDLGLFNKRSTETDSEIVKNIRFSLQNYDALIVNQQVVGSITNQSFIDEANNLFDEFSNKIVVIDTRDYSQEFRNVYRKCNQKELAILYGVEAKSSDHVSKNDIKNYGIELFKK